MKKVSKAKIASTYGLALYNAAFDKDVVQNVLTDVRILLTAIDADADFVKYLANPVLDNNAKKEVLKEIAKKIHISEETLSCLDIIIDNGRAIDLALICKEYINVYYKKHNIEEVFVTSVVELDAAQKNNLETKLENKINKKIVTNYNIDINILGGLQIKYGSIMIDDSVFNKLNRIENLMKGE